MFNQFTRHVQLRMRQRGKSAEDVRMALRYGTRRAKGGGRVVLRKKEAERQIARRKAWLARLGNRNPPLARAMRRRMRSLEKMRGVAVVVEHGVVKTVYNLKRRFSSRRLRRRRQKKR